MSPRRRILPLFIPHLGCPHDCIFCNQKRISGQLDPVTPEDVTAALEALPLPVEELAFYGGSFTALPCPAQAALLEAAQPFVADGQVGAIRVSTRPDAIDGAVLALLRENHVETIELGAQSMDNDVLLASGRGHTAEDTVRATRQIQEMGFRLILQMMTGLPGSDAATDYKTGEALADLNPDGVRIYPTVVLRDTALYGLWQRGEYRAHTVEDAVEICARLLPLFEDRGIPVIRLGLNPSEELSGGAAVAGAYHPALGELVKSRVLLEKAQVLLRKTPHGDRVVLGVCQPQVSQLIGQHRQNLLLLQEEFHLNTVQVLPSALPPGEISLIS